MKKFVSALVVLAMVLALLPAAALAVAPQDANSYNVTVGFNETVDLFAMDTITLNITTGAQDAKLIVKDLWYICEWHLDNGMQTLSPDVNGVCTLKLQPNTTTTIHILSETMFEDTSLQISLETFVLGTEENPEGLVLGDNSAVVDGTAAYFYQWKADHAGNFTIAIDTARCSDWSFQIISNLTDGQKIYGDTHYSDLDPVEPSETIHVEAGDVLTICVNTANYGFAGEIFFNASFVKGVSGGGETGDGEGSIVGDIIESQTVTIQSASAYKEENKVKNVFFTATEEGTVYITMSSPEKGWSLTVYKNDEAMTWRMTGSKQESFGYPVKPGDVMRYEIGAYDATTDWVEVDGKVTYTISFEAGAVEIIKEPYLFSEILLYLGDNDLTMMDNAEYTLFEFTPDQTGVYTFTAPAGALIGDWGTFFNPVDHSGDNKTNTLQWTCTDVGQNIVVGVAGDEDIVLNVERTGDYVPDLEVEWTIYENQAILDYFELDPNADMEPVDVTDDIADLAVLGADGYYHLGDANGPILFIDMNQYIFPASNYGNVSYIVYGENGEVLDRINYTNAVIEYYSYSDGGVYPVTVDLIEFYKNYGRNQGWYDINGTGFYLFGEDEVDPETAWMFACYFDPAITSFMSDYIVAGEAGLCGSNWDPTDYANQMVMNADGTCSITFENVAAGKYMFKVTQGDWDLDSWGGNGPDGNYVINLGTDTFVTIIFNPATEQIKVVTGENAGTGDYGMAELVVAMMTAAAGVVVLTKKKEF